MSIWIALISCKIQSETSNERLTKNRDEVNEDIWLLSSI